MRSTNPPSAQWQEHHKSAIAEMSSIYCRYIVDLSTVYRRSRGPEKRRQIGDIDKPQNCIGPLRAYEGPATNSGHRNPPRHILDFEENKLFYLRPDLPHSWIFPEHSQCQNPNPSIFGNHASLREFSKTQHPRTLNLYPTGDCLVCLAS